MRIEHSEQRVGELGKFVLQLDLQSGGKKCKSLDKPLNMRVLGLARFFTENQATGNVGVFARKIFRQMSDGGQLVLVFLLQAHRHYCPPVSTTCHSPLPDLTTVSKVTGTGAGETRKRASTHIRSPRPLVASAVIDVTRTSMSRGSNVAMVFSIIVCNVFR